MADYTKNYNLKKPAGTDFVKIDDINGNMDSLDTALKHIETNVGESAQETTLQEVKTDVESLHEKLGVKGSGAGNAATSTLFEKTTNAATSASNAYSMASTVNNKVGTSTDTGSTTMFGGIKNILSNLTSHMGAWTTARAAKLDNVDASVSSRAPASTALSNAVWTSARAEKIDKIGEDISTIKPLVGGYAIFTTSGTFTIPTGVSQIYITGIGAGGAGGNMGDRETFGGGGGGGCGCYIEKKPFVVEPNSLLEITVGTGNTIVKNSDFLLLLERGINGKNAQSSGNGNNYHDGAQGGGPALRYTTATKISEDGKAKDENSYFGAGAGGGSFSSEINGNGGNGYGIGGYSKGGKRVGNYGGGGGGGSSPFAVGGDGGDGYANGAGYDGKDGKYGSGGGGSGGGSRISPREAGREGSGGKGGSGLVIIQW